jgi:hypothetical protein
MGNASMACVVLMVNMELMGFVVLVPIIPTVPDLVAVDIVTRGWTVRRTAVRSAGFGRDSLVDHLVVGAERARTPAEKKNAVQTAQVVLSDLMERDIVGSVSGIVVLYNKVFVYSLSLI